MYDTVIFTVKRRQNIDMVESKKVAQVRFEWTFDEPMGSGLDE